jgi:hypothetical protein
MHRYCPARQGKARQGKARQGKARQGKARQGKARQGKARQGKAKQSKAKQSKAKQSKAKQSKAKQSKAKQSKAKQSSGLAARADKASSDGKICSYSWRPLQMRWRAYRLYARQCFDDENYRTIVWTDEGGLNGFVCYLGDIRCFKYWCDVKQFTRTRKVLTTPAIGDQPIERNLTLF